MQDKDLLTRLVQYSLNDKENKILKEILVDNASGRYFITRQGEIISLCHEMPIKRKAKDNGDGYLKVDIACKNYYIHRLVADAYLRWNKQEKPCIHHIDRRKENNAVENLLPLTIEKHNMIHYFLNKWEKMDII